jgi:SMC interacting uncharacterized protein involved in chromosome segregation
VCTFCQQDKDHNMKIEELQCEIGHRERHIKNLKDEIHDLKNNIERRVVQAFALLFYQLCTVSRLFL